MMSYNIAVFYLNSVYFTLFSGVIHGYSYKRQNYPDGTGGIDLVVVKVETNQDGLYGLGCATFTQRIFAVKAAIDDYIRPFLIGKDAERIEDIWQSAAVSGYWRNGPVMNNAISAIDMALWDIKGKMANMPVYQLLGGKCRDGIPLYRHCDGADAVEAEDNILAAMEEGYQYVRCQMGMYGGAGTDDLKLIATQLNRAKDIRPKRSPRTRTSGIYFDPTPMPEASRSFLTISEIKSALTLSLSTMCTNAFSR